MLSSSRVRALSILGSKILNQSVEETWKILKLHELNEIRNEAYKNSKI